MKSDEHIIVLCSGVLMIPLFLLALNHWKIYTRVSLIMHKTSVENAGQGLNQNGLPIEMNYSPIHRDEKTYPTRFSSLWAIEAEVMRRRKLWERKKKAYLWPRYIFFILWKHLQLEYACNAARYKMESRAGRVLTGVGTNLKLQRDLLFAAKRIDADVRFGFSRLKWRVCEFIPC